MFKNYLCINGKKTELSEKETSESFRTFERFKLQWMLDHGHTLQELFCGMDALSRDYEDLKSIQELFIEWEQNCGFGSEIWPCYEEWLGYEAKKPDCGLIDTRIYTCYNVIE